MHNVPASGRLLGAMWCGAEPPSYRVLCPCRSPTVGPSRAACPAVPWGFAPRSPLPWVATAGPVPSSLAPHLLLHCPRLPVRVKSPQAGWGLTALHPHIRQPGEETSLLENGKSFCPPYGAYLFTRLRNYFSFLLAAFSFPLNPS